MPILLTLLLTCSAVVATIHDDRRQAFRSAAERLPEQVEDLIRDFYLELTYGDNPRSPILSLEETQAQVLFPPLHLEGVNSERVKYDSERLNQTMPKDRYLNLHVTESTDDNDQDDVTLTFKRDSNCPNEPRYFLANGAVYQWSRANQDPYKYFLRLSPWNNMWYILWSKAKMNRELEPGTKILLHVPQECTLKLQHVSRTIGIPPIGNEGRRYPATISVATPLPLVPSL